MRKFIGIAIFFALLSFVVPAFAAVGVDDKDGYVGEASNIDFEGQDVTFDGSKVTVLANGHKTGVSTGVSNISNITSAKLSYGVYTLVIYESRTIALGKGTAGQMVTFVVITDNGGSNAITFSDDNYVPSEVAETGWDDVALDNAGDSVTFLYVDDTNGWIIVGQYGASVT